MTKKFYDVYVDGGAGSDITPEDRKKWDKAMADHAKRQKTPQPFLKIIIRLICAFVVAGIVGALIIARFTPSPETRDPETILNDTLQMNQGDLSRDSSLEEMKQTPVGREYDSLIKGREHE